MCNLNYQSFIATDPREGLQNMVKVVAILKFKMATEDAVEKMAPYFFLKSAPHIDNV